MNTIIQYNVAFMSLYWVMSLCICIMGGYNLTNRKLLGEAWRGTKSLAIQLPLSNLAIATLAPKWSETQSVAACIAYVVCFDIIVFWYHTAFHASPYLYKKIHREHHMTHYVCPFSATSLSMSEHIVIGILPTLLPLYVIPMSEAGWGIINAAFFIHGLFIHSNIRSPFECLGFIGTREHAAHHVRPKTHMGFLIPWFGSAPFNGASDELNADIIKYYSF